MVYRYPKLHDRLNIFNKLFLRVLRGLLDIRQLVEAGIVSLAPTYLYARPKAGAIYAKNIYFSDGEFKTGDELSPEEKDFVTNDMKAVTADLHGRRSDVLTPSRIISVQINGDPTPINRVQRRAVRWWKRPMAASCTRRCISSQTKSLI